MRRYSRKTHIRAGLEGVSTTAFWVALIVIPLQKPTVTSGLLVVSGVFWMVSRMVKVDKVFKTK